MGDVTHVAEACHTYGEAFLCWKADAEVEGGPVVLSRFFLRFFERKKLSYFLFFYFLFFSTKVLF